MKYKDLIAESFVIKLLQTTFKNPSTNIKIWRFYQTVKPCYEFLFNENKKHNGNEEYFNQMLQCDLEFELPKLDYICVECNYFERNDYIEELPYINSTKVEKRRLKSHMSAETCIDFINNQDLTDLKEIRLLHLSGEMTLSERQNLPQIFKEKIKKEGIKIVV